MPLSAKTAWPFSSTAVVCSNMESKQQEGYMENGSGETQHEYSGESINAFAKNEQQKNG